VADANPMLAASWATNGNFHVALDLVGGAWPTVRRLLAICSVSIVVANCPRGRGRRGPDGERRQLLTLARYGVYQAHEIFVLALGGAGIVRRPAGRGRSLPWAARAMGPVNSGGSQALRGDGGADEQGGGGQLTSAVYENGPVRIWSLRSRPS
jgi:hypothetical protein